MRTDEGQKMFGLVGYDGTVDPSVAEQQAYDEAFGPPNPRPRRTFEFDVDEFLVAA